jgi:DNA helicase-2/ATP-dependent DNA helicase PcrA
MTLSLHTDLNTEQSRAASLIHGPVLIIAGAGSGKTRMICYRIAHMLEMGIGAQEILALTFTNKAAAEMAMRVRDLTQQPLTELTTSTFHAFGLRILREQGELVGYSKNFTIYDTSDCTALLKEVLLEEHLDPQAYDIADMLHLFSDIKMGRSGWPTNSGVAIKSVYDGYLEHMRLYNAVDFDDLIMLPLRLFERYPHILEMYQKRYSYIMVDEFQDTSREQYRLVEQLAAGHRNLCVVGDDDQSIYSWRGANYQNIVLFETDFPERTEIKLEQNYRSSGTILKAANTLILHNSQRKEKALWTDGHSGGKITRLYPENEEVEVQTILKEIRSVSYSKQLSYRSFCILVRANHLIPAFENACMLEQIPVQVSGGQSFFERKEIKDTVSYLRILANPDDDMALLRIINTPRRKIGRSTLSAIRSIAHQHHCSLYRAMDLMMQHAEISEAKKKEPVSNLYDLIETYRSALFAAGRKKSRILRALMEEIGYKEYLAQEYPGNDQAVLFRYGSIQTFIRLFSQWEQDEDNLSPSVYDYLQRLSLHSRDQKEETGPPDALSIMTIHAAKGLEFDCVFLAGVEDHMIPHARTIEENPEALEEERRLFYVAITRAKQDLYISTCNQRKRNREIVPSMPSRFLSEIPEDLFQEPLPPVQLDQDETIAAFAALKRRLAEKESS